MIEKQLQILQKDFTADEFRQRRIKLYEQLNGASALIKGAPHDGSSDVFRQYNEFYYLCGIERSHSYLLLDGSTRTTTLFMTERSAHEMRDQGVSIGLQDAELVKQASAVDEVLGLDQLAEKINAIDCLYIMSTWGEGRMAYQDTLRVCAKDVQADPMDQRPNEAAYFIEKVKSINPAVEIKDLFPIIEKMRIIKSPAEIELMHKAGKVTALAVLEAMKSTKAGVYEYHLQAIADYVYRLHGCRGAGYKPIIATGDNIWNTHYYRCHSELKDGDLVLMDYACDLRNYTSDIGRFWPVNGKYSDKQRNFYGWVVDYHKCLLEHIRPGVLASDIESEVAAIMEERLATMTFEDEETKKGFYKTLTTRHLTHGVGMTVHDSGNYYPDILEPGVVIAVDPQMWIPEKEFYIRVEDTIVVTEDGCLNFTDLAPLDLDDTEKVIGTGGMLQAFPQNKDIL